jgi:hypothetical protein
MDINRKIQSEESQPYAKIKFLAKPLQATSNLNSRLSFHHFYDLNVVNNQRAMCRHSRAHYSYVMSSQGITFSETLEGDRDYEQLQWCFMLYKVRRPSKKLIRIQGWTYRHYKSSKDQLRLLYPNYRQVSLGPSVRLRGPMAQSGLRLSPVPQSHSLVPSLNIPITLQISSSMGYRDE